MSLRTARLPYAIAVVGLLIGYFVVPVARPATTVGLGALGLAAIGLGLVIARPRLWAPVVLIATAVVLVSAGNVVLVTSTGDDPGRMPLPTPSDGLYLAACLPLTVGMLWLGRPDRPSREWPMLLDTVVLSLAGSLVMWIAVARPAVQTLQLAGVARIIAIASWVGFVAVLAATIRVLFAWRTNPSLVLLGTATIAFLVSGFLYWRRLIDQGWAVGSLADLGFLAFGALCGAAALSKSVRRVPSARYGRHHMGPVRLAALTLAVLVAPTALLVQATQGQVATGVAIAVVAAAAGVLILIRLWLTARAYRDSTVRERLLQIALQDLQRATTEAEVVTTVHNALRAMPGLANPPIVRLEAFAPDQDERVTRIPDIRGNAVGELRVALDADVHDAHVHNVTAPTESGDAAKPARSPLCFVFTASMTDLVEQSSVLQVLAHQAGAALHRIDMLADLRAEERERYFRTLVLTSEDVTLIVRDGIVAYATPSARALFGRDVVRARITDIVRLHREADRPRHRASALSEPTEGTVRRPSGEVLTVRVRQRDLRDDPTVCGVVATLHDITAERELQRDLAYRASHDPLTGLLNAEAFSAVLNAEATHTGGRHHARALGAVLFIDLDDFKTVNDTYGHEIGDELLKEVARRIRSCLRSEDIAARIGGDEFAVLLRGPTGVEAARAVAQRVTDALLTPAIVEEFRLDCQASVGLAYAEPPQPGAVLRKADTALYSAKALGKGHWREYREGMSAPPRRHAENRRRLESAIRAGRLALHYQPIVDLQSGRAAGFEARVHLPEAEPPLVPGEVIAIAEETGLMPMLGEWILRQALIDQARLNASDSPHRRYVSVNISARQARQPDFVDMVRARLAETGSDGSLLVLEVTEALLVEDGRAWSFVDQLRRDGVRLAIDDYGTGHGSFGYFRESSIGIIKIDHSFFDDLSDVRGRWVLEAVAELCQRLDLDLIANGVTDRESVRQLVSLGCRHGQGDLLGPAMPVADAMHWP